MITRKCSLTTFLCFACLPYAARADALDKLTPEKLETVHQAIAGLKAQRVEVPARGPYQDVRANLHVHSLLSHDSRGKIEDIVAAAKRAGTRVLMFTEHPSERYDYFKEGHHGIRDGVLLIPGAETGGFLVFPRQSMRGLKTSTSQEFADLVRRQDGLVFLSHLEERMDWDIKGITGCEIYNTHADFKDEKRLASEMRKPLWIVKTADLIRRYPQEVFSALQDYPADYLKRWDELCAGSRKTGVAANDSHQNVGLVAKAAEGNKILLEDPIGSKLAEVDTAKIPLLAPLRKDKKPGDILFKTQLDPYEFSLRHAGTHLLIKDVNEEEVRAALAASRAYVAFDWLADPTGFDFAASAGSRRFEMGSEVPLTAGLRLEARSTLPVHWKVVCKGKVVTESDGRALEYAVDKPGNYRVEAWLDIAGDRTIWILSNPIWVQAAR